MPQKTFLLTMTLNTIKSAVEYNTCFELVFEQCQSVPSFSI